MPQTTLTWLRFITPGVIIAIFIGLVGVITQLWPTWRPANLQDLTYSLSVIIPAGIYYLTPLRDWMNGQFHRQISKNIRDRLVNISGLPDQPNVYTWKALRGIFYHLIDNDNSLRSKASLAYFNGYIWSTLADIRALSFPFAFISIVLWYINIDNAGLVFSVFVALILFSYSGSKIVTKEHKSIGDQQLEIIEHLYKDDLVHMMEAVRDRATVAGNKASTNGA